MLVSFSMSAEVHKFVTSLDSCLSCPAIDSSDLMSHHLIACDGGIRERFCLPEQLLLSSAEKKGP